MTVLERLGRLFNICTDRRVSSDWLKQRSQQDTRIEFHGVSMQWPINKRINEHALFNTKRLRRRA